MKVFVGFTNYMSVSWKYFFKKRVQYVCIHSEFYRIVEFLNYESNFEKVKI